MVEVSPSQDTGVAVMIGTSGKMQTGSCLNQENLGTLKVPKTASFNPSPSTSPKSTTGKLPITVFSNPPFIVLCVVPK